MYDEFDRLSGVTVSSILLKGDEIVINDSFRLSAYGDCCSVGWLSALKVPDGQLVLTGKFKELENIFIESGEPDFPENGDVVVRTSIQLETNGEPITFYMWNDSNGYYGSSLSIEVIK